MAGINVGGFIIVFLIDEGTGGFVDARRGGGTTVCVEIKEGAVGCV